jgi:hypothetical protein
MVITKNAKLWLWIGAVFGMAFLNKYSIVFFASAITIALFISEHRRLALSGYAVFGGIIGLMVILPNIIWQNHYNWPVVRHMAELQRTQLVNVTMANYLTEQVMMCFASVIIWGAGLALLFLPDEKKYRFIVWSFIMVIGIILFGRGKPYYTLGAYPMMLACGGYVLEKYLTKAKRYLVYSVLLITVSISILTLPLALPFASFKTVKRYCDPKTGITMQRWEDGKIYPIPQDYADMTGWRELTGIVAKAYNSLDGRDKSRCTIYAENYGLAGAIQFYGHRFGLPAPVSFSDSYLLWAPDSLVEGPWIYVNHQIGDMDDLFIETREIGRVENEYFREKGVMVLLCTGPVEEAKKFYATKVRMLKNNFSKQDGCIKAAAIALPGIIQAEDCCNSGGIEMEITADSTGGSNIGWIDSGDWMEYKIDIPAGGTCPVTLRVASFAGGGEVTISSNGTPRDTLMIPSTGGWQKWTTINTTLNLSGGIQIVRFTAITGGWNMNWFRVDSDSIIAGQRVQQE